MVITFRKGKKNASSPRKGDATEPDEYQTRLGLLCDIAEEATSISRVAALLERILKVTLHSLDATIATLFLNDAEKAEVYAPRTVSRDDEPGRQPSLIETEIASLVALTGKPVVINDVAADRRFNPEGRSPSELAIQSAIAVPILRGKGVIGILMAANKEDGTFTERDFDILNGFAATEALILLVSMHITAVANMNWLELHDYLFGNRAAVPPVDGAASKDTYLHGHPRRVREYALLAAGALRLSPEMSRTIELGALLHDVGNIGIDERILIKPEPLTDEDWQAIRKHPRTGAAILEDIPCLKEARDIVLYHHERYDGKGYPEGLKGEKIPLGARLVAVADAFDAMTTEHPYRPPLEVEVAIKELIEGTGTQFCPRAVEAFITAFRSRHGKAPTREAAVEATEPQQKREKKPEAKVPKPTAKAPKPARPSKEPRDTPEDINTLILQGIVRLSVPITAPTEEVKQFQRELQRLPGVSILMLSHAEEEGHLFLLALQTPMPLLRIIRENPLVEGIARVDGGFMVSLKE